jgi:hypothetical protein
MATQSQRDRQARWYKENRERLKNGVNERRNRLKREASEKINKYKSENSCTDCGNFFHHVSMDFDHLSQKRMDVARMVAAGYVWTEIQKEIDKCELVCSNCHRVRTWLRGLPV